MDNINNLQPKGMSSTEFKEYNKNQKIGQTNFSNSGTLMKIIDYNDATDVVIEFQDELHYVVHASYRAFKIGTVKNPGQRVIYNIGYIGVGPFLTCHKINGKKVETKAYDAWHRMLQRCYDNNYHLRYPTYIGSTVCDEWQNFQTFAKWFYQKQYSVLDNQSLEVDKDWLYIGNKIYCPERCCLVPNIINTCLLTHDKIINFNLPIGVCPTASGKYKARCSKYGKRIDLGTYNTPQEAESVYWKFKISYIEELANEYKYVIEERLYNAMINFKSTYLERYNLTNKGDSYVQ